MLMPSGQVVTLACLLGQTLHQLKDHFSQELKLPVNLILLMFDGNTHEKLVFHPIPFGFYFTKNFTVDFSLWFNVDRNRSYTTIRT